MKLLEFIFTNFWYWLGSMVFLYIITHFITNTINKIMRHRNIRKHGYPPEHCDADGEFKNVFNIVKKNEGEI